MSDDLEHWSGSDTASGWGVTVNPGFIDLEAKKADPVQPGSSAAPGAVLPDTADIDVTCCSGTSKLLVRGSIYIYFH